MAMHPDDPFEQGGGDRTIMVPRPGRQSEPRAAPPRNAPMPPQPPAGATQARVPPASPRPPQAAAGRLPALGLNPLVDAAAELLILAPELRSAVAYAAPAKLYAQVGAQIKAFDEAARAAGYPDATVLAARYVLCAFVDEAVLATPWGSESQWPSRTLLSAFHKETSGGERFFSILSRFAQQPASNLDVLELMYLCLALGFQGKYGISDRGYSQLVELQDDLAATIARQRGDFERELSPRWQGVRDQRNRLVRYVPLWVVCSLAGVVLLMLYSGFRFSLSSSAQPVHQGLQAVVEGSESR